MPIFEFRCLECGNLFEKLFLRSDEEAELECPECKAASLERVVSKTNFAMGLPAGAKGAQLTTKSCGSGNSCTSFTLPGHTRE